MKNPSDTETKDKTKSKGQFAKSAKVKNEQFNEQGTDSQSEVNAEEEEWLESRKVQKEQSGYERDSQSQRRRKDSF